MDLTKAQRLLIKIQAFLDNGNAHELSRLEKDLIKSYVQQLYEAVTSEEQPPVHEPHKHMDPVPTRKYSEEPIVKVETPVTKVPEPQRPEPPKPVYTEYVEPIVKKEPVEVQVPVMELKKSEAPVDDQPYQFHIPDPVKIAHVTGQNPIAISPQEALNKLFDTQKSDDVSRFGHVPIVTIESAMGLNERIFTLNELFGGDKTLFDLTCSRLNNLSSFAEAKNLLMVGPAKDYRWGDPERIKMAEQFIRIVSRKYPKSAS